jgi:hypothetical protein
VFSSPGGVDGQLGQELEFHNHPRSKQFDRTRAGFIDHLLVLLFDF